MRINNQFSKRTPGFRANKTIIAKPDIMSLLNQLIIYKPVDDMFFRKLETEDVTDLYKKIQRPENNCERLIREKVQSGMKALLLLTGEDVPEPKAPLPLTQNISDVITVTAINLKETGKILKTLLNPKKEVS